MASGSERWTNFAFSLFMALRYGTTRGDLVRAIIVLEESRHSTIDCTASALAYHSSLHTWAKNDTHLSIFTLIAMNITMYSEHSIPLHFSSGGCSKSRCQAVAQLVNFTLHSSLHQIHKSHIESAIYNRPPLIIPVRIYGQSNSAL